MKNKIFGALIGATFMIVGALSFTPVKVHANENEEEGAGGEWVAFYDGGATPIFCKCVSSFVWADCVVGDTNTVLSECY